MQNQKMPRLGYDNVAFEQDGMRIVGTVIGIDDDGTLLVGNAYYDVIWNVPVEQAITTEEPMSRPPVDY